MFVTDDEAERLALETVQQLAEIEPNFDELGDAEDLSNLQTKKTDENIQTTKNNLQLESKIVVEKPENKANINEPLSASNDDKINKENIPKFYSIFDKNGIKRQKSTETRTQSPKIFKKSKAITTQVSTAYYTFIINQF